MDLTIEVDMTYMNWGLTIVVAISFVGCTKTQAPVSEPKSGGVVRGDTSDLPVYTKAAGPTVDITKFPSGIQQLFKQIDPAPHIEEYKETHGRYPADYAEFKSGIVEPKKLKFPSKLPAGMQLHYDENNHRVLIVKVTKGKRSAP